MMAALRHPNVVAFLGVCPSPPCVATGGGWRGQGQQRGRLVKSVVPVSCWK